MTQAPELLDWSRVEKYTSSIDLWSIGCVAFRLLFGKYPFSGTRTERLREINSANGPNLIIPETNKISLKVLLTLF